MNYKIMAFGGTSVVSLAIGSVAGYLYGKKKLDTVKDELEEARRVIEEAALDVTETKKFYRMFRKEGEFETPGAALAHLMPEEADAEVRGQDYRKAVVKQKSRYITTPFLSEEEGDGAEEDEPDIFETYDEPENPAGEFVEHMGLRFRRKEFNYTPEERAALKEEARVALATYRAENPESVVVLDRNIFDNAQSDGGEEMPADDEDQNLPYVISDVDFMQNELEHNSVTLTYYEGDRTLVDERDEPIEDLDGTIGAHILMRFGERSNDKNVVYIRNKKLDLDIELIRSKGSYATEVLGLGEGHEIRSHRKR